jgi:hypothetical protein
MNQAFNQDVPLSLLTMAVGAVLGAVLTPFGDAATGLILERKGRLRGLDTAFILFFAANGVWIIAEIFVELFVRLDSEQASWQTGGAVALLFSLAAITFAIGFRHVPPREKFKANSGVIILALKYLFVGNIIWIAGEVVETFAWEFLPSEPTFLIRSGILFLVAAIGFFLAGMRAVWRASQED